MDKPRISGNQIAIPANAEYLADVDMFIEGILRGYEADESLIADIAISVSELVNNAITHGANQSSDSEVTVAIKRESDTVVISVADQGGGFDPDDIADPLAQENLLKEVGRGIFIVKSLMDRVDVDQSESGTTVTICKALK